MDNGPHPNLTAIAVFAGALSAAACGGDLYEVAEHSQLSTNIHETEVCFTVRNPSDLFDSQVSGTLFHTDHYTVDSTAIVLLHGSVADRTAWDGGHPAISGVPSMARLLARAGYGVFALDRLGYADSPYAGNGHQLVNDAAVRRIHQEVQQVRQGSFDISSGACADLQANSEIPGAAKVVLMGFSAGGGLSESYATRYDDVDGIVSMAWGNNGTSSEVDRLIQKNIIPQLLAGKDHVYFFAADEDGYSHDCERALMYAPGTTPHALEQICGPSYYGTVEDKTSPAGEFTTLVAMMEETRLNIGNVGPSTAALKVFADKDAMFTNADFRGHSGDEPDVVTPEIEMWESSCNCDFTFLFQQDTSHAGWFHKTARHVTYDILDWLASRGL